MKKLLYLTTSIDPNDYSFLLKKSISLTNPSNQNFHARAISALKSSFEVKVLSRVPSIPQGYKLLDNDSYRYVERPGGLLPRLFPSLERKEMLARIEGDIDAILFDSLSVPLSAFAIYIGKTLHVPAIAFLTDSPFNITGLGKAKAERIVSYASKADAAIALTEPLIDVFHMADKPSIIVSGVASESEVPPFEGPRPYFYFGGALLGRYGAPTLIESFLNANLENTDLYVAGHHGEDLPKGKNVRLLGQVTLEENCAYQKGAVALINPRPFDPRLDSESVPSKMFEYLSFGQAVVSTENTFFQKEFQNEINWIGKGSAIDFSNFFASYKAAGPSFVKKITPESRKAFLAKYGKEAFAERVKSFLASLE